MSCGVDYKIQRRTASTAPRAGHEDSRLQSLFSVHLHMAASADRLSPHVEMVTAIPRFVCPLLRGKAIILSQSHVSIPAND